MKATELRIGNWINEQGLELQVGMINTEVLKSAEPIPLTEEWLVKFGFEKSEDVFDNIYHRYNGFEMENINTYCGVGNNQKIQYVHQLQNLYFALTGEELKLK